MNDLISNSAESAEDAAMEQQQEPIFKRASEVDDSVKWAWYARLMEQEEQSQAQNDGWECDTQHASTPPQEPQGEELSREQMNRIIQSQLDKAHYEELRSKIEPYILRASDKIPPLRGVIKRQGELICTEGNISAIVGEAKSKKTFLCTAIVGAIMDVCKEGLFGFEPNRCRVLWFDTEQSKEHFQKVLFRINLLGKLPITTSDRMILPQLLREEPPQKRLTTLCYAIEYHQPRLVVIDGVSDLLTSINNLEESEALVAQLLSLSSLFSCHIMCVLHTNPNSDKARGHLGSTLMRKAETVMFVHKVGQVSVVEPQYCRNMPFERFAFKVEEVENADSLGEEYAGLGIPVECALPSETECEEDVCLRLLRDEFGGVAERTLLVSKVEQTLGVTRNNARVKVHRAVERGILRQEGDLVKVSQ